MIGKKRMRLLIDPQEVITTARKYGTVDTVDIAVQLRDEWNRQTNTALWNGERDFKTLCMLAAIFDAGRMQGIREERAKGAAV